MPAKMILFASVALLVLLSVLLYVGWRLGAGLSTRWRFALWGVMLVFFVLLPATFMTIRAARVEAWHRMVQWVGFTVLGLLTLLFAGLALVDIARLLLALSDRLAQAAGLAPPSRLLLPADPARRRFLGNLLRLGVVAVAGGLAGLGWRRAVQLPELEEVDIPIPGLPPGLEGFRIVQVTDLHVTGLSSKEHLAALVEQVNALSPDVIAVTGDLVDGSAPAISEIIEPLGGLSARHGVFFVTGNHEYYSGVDVWLDEVRRLGMRPLVNEHAPVDHRGARLLLAGVTDARAGQLVSAHRSDPAKALEGAPDAAVRVLLAHQPASALEAAGLGLDLVLCGHTHGGQFFPWNLVIHLAQPFAVGHYRHQGMHVYTSRGTGYWGPPNRLGVPPELTLLRLVGDGRDGE